MGIFSGIDVSNAKTSGGIGFELLPGSYVLKVTETKGFKSRKNEPCFEVLFTVEESTNEAQKVGSIANEFNMLNNDYGPGRVKTILAVMNGLDVSNVADADIIASENWNELLEVAVTKPELFAGRLVNCTVTKAKAKNGKEYNRKTYSPNKAVREKTLAAVKKAGK